jgi:hypothetical protein
MRELREAEKSGRNPIVPCSNTKCNGFIVRQNFHSDTGKALGARNYCTKCAKTISYEDYYSLVAEAGDEFLEPSASSLCTAMPH